MPLRSRSRRIVLVAALTLALFPNPGEAHAILEASDPPPGAKTAAGSIAMKLRFNSRIDRARSRLTLTNPGGTKTTPPIDPDGPPDILTTTLTLTPGAYVLRWQVLAVDGHITRGDVPFTVTGK